MTICCIDDVLFVAAGTFFANLSLI
ncbi:hypothetical protein CY0110_19452 [Crocosphaera chwakensis CCY0110]|uniref:Uncharacterized protein n=1 Tax=Crocosphaera chwakensis CCY0110 TaxID=391612 RepID=A3IJM2_9CHRO|nr:hypothetical protein CY0110_19452 [Crocosphaera chwakensis CCY0110]